MRTFLILALGTVLGVIARPASPGYRNDTIFSLLYTKDVIFASTRTGLFRGNPETRSWTPVHLPPGTKPGGCLNATDSG
nr:hypothetical protein [Candidatus Acidoferrales bacterium]